MNWNSARKEIRVLTLKRNKKKDNNIIKSKRREKKKKRRKYGEDLVEGGVSLELLLLVGADLLRELIPIAARLNYELEKENI